MGEHFKGIANTLSKEVAAAEGKVSTITEWIKKYNSADLTEKSIKDVPELPDTAELTQLQSDLDSIEQTNKKIAQNITYIQLEAKAKSGLMPMPEQPTESEEPLISAKTKATTEYNAAEAFVKKMSALHGTCPTCLSSIDEAKVSSLVEEQQVIMSQALNHRDHYDERLKQLRAAKSAWEKAQKAQTEWEKYHQLIDPKLPQELQDAAEISSRITSLSEEIKETKRAIKNIQDANNLAVAHNSKVAVIKGQMAEMQVELEEWGTKLNALSNRASMLAILVKTFSTTGLVAYKIENLVKDLEELTNTYLGELSGGRFQITFQISGSDKLNVVVTDNGTDIDIVALSGGERARVNIATLLAIRKLMQSLSKSRLNLLILDETVEALDPESKEKLIEVLLNEENLNIILVSHSFSHPLLEKVHIVKRNNISRIEE